MILALAQINPVVSDLDGNRDRIVASIRQARDAGASVVVFPELAIAGYPPRDLLLKPRFIADAARAVESAAAACVGITALIGWPAANPAPEGRPLFNSVALCRDGRIAVAYQKSLLPSYDVFDETRYFEPGAPAPVVDLNGGGADGARAGLPHAGICICEDMWGDPEYIGRSRYHRNPIETFKRAGAGLVINVSASPYSTGKQAFRERLFGGQAAKHGLPTVVVNQVGGNDELLFDGASSAYDAAGRVVARARAFEEDLLLIDTARLGSGPAGRIEPYPSDDMHAALVMGTRDYVRKCGFSRVVVGLSGGIDSAVTAAIAAESLGADAVLGVAMPSRFSSDHSIEDARQLATNLGIEFATVPIDPLHRAGEAALADLFAGRAPDATEENLQARARGMILMAISNKFGRLVLTTGNKSELAVGYCTLYGDMCGGLAVLSDVPKTSVYGLARSINARAGRALIPRRSIDKPPSAELRPDQTDQDTLPPYDVLDAVIYQYVECERGIDDIVAMGFDESVVAGTIRRIDHNEYKRRQAAPGLRVTGRAFGMGRRMPIATG